MVSRKFIHRTVSRKQMLAYISGFTLIELIVVMAIMSIIATTFFGNFYSTFTKGRDSQRKQNIESVGKALELYYNDNRAYPTVIPGGGTPLVNPANPSTVYMVQIPADPAASVDYCYNSDGTYFKLYTQLENKNDPKLIPTITCSGTGIPGYNYGISSGNVRP